MINNVTRMSGSADYDPFFELTTGGREPVYLAQDGAAYRIDAKGAGVALWKEGARRLSRIR